MKIGHTGITWGIPGDVERAYRDVAELGYLGFETFGETILNYNKPGGYRALVESCGIPTVAAYCYREWIDPAGLAADLEAVRRQAGALKEVGGYVMVFQAGRRLPGGYSRDQFQRLADALNQAGEYCRSIGLRSGLHPHTGTAVETREEIDTILSLLDPDLVGLAPDTGQIAKGGSDILEVMRTYLDRITHVHLKDWSGQVDVDENGQPVDVTGFVNYQPIGHGILPIPEILKILQEGGYEGWINVELDPGPNAPYSPREAAAMSRRYLGEILGDQVAWRGQAE